jgi:transcriptional regulator with XRE-family HTH domain
MHLDDLNTDAGVLAELGRRLARNRLARNWTQDDLAREAGVGPATVQRLEGGRSVQMRSMIRIMRALGLLEALDAAIPESVTLPIAQLERERKLTRQRARAGKPRGPTRREPRWRWADDDSPNV